VGAAKKKKYKKKARGRKQIKVFDGRDGGVGFDVMADQLGSKCAEHVHRMPHTLGGAVGAENTVLG
jgi:hypothetical protein